MKKVCILGVGRSGTTALFTMLQEIMLDQFKGNIDFVYEPFLWDKDVFNGRYSDVIEYFKYMDSISIDGMYNHQKLPLFISNPGRYRKNEYLRGIFQKNTPHNNILIKFIRANGRFLLLNKICPECKFIFIIRNPIDVINSAIIRFSFYGSEFHKNDFNRFVNEINSLYSENIEVGTSQIEREVLFWYYMNKFALESFQKVNNKPLIIPYEDYITNREIWVDRICDFIGIQKKEKYYKFSLRQGGSNTISINLNKKEFELLYGYIEKYKVLLMQGGKLENVDFSGFLDKYCDLPAESIERRLVLGATPNFMNNRIIKLEEEIERKDKELRILKRKFRQIKNEPNYGD